MRVAQHRYPPVYGRWKLSLVTELPQHLTMATEKPNSSPSKRITARDSRSSLSDIHILSLDSLKRSRPPQIQALLQAMNHVSPPTSTSNMVSNPITSNIVFTPS